MLLDANSYQYLNNWYTETNVNRTLNVILEKGNKSNFFLAIFFLVIFSRWEIKLKNLIQKIISLENLQKGLVFFF